MERRPIKTVFSPDGARRLEIYGRDDGLFSFRESVAARTRLDEPCWTPTTTASQTQAHHSRGGKKGGDDVQEVGQNIMQRCMTRG
jgi:hypothetical protein